MRKRVLMSSVAATVVASMFMFTGCGSSSSDKEVKTSISATEVKASPVATTPAVATPAVRPVCTKIEGGVVGVQVIGYDNNGNEMDRTRSGANGEVCFATAPASIKVIGSGNVDNLKTHCTGDAQAYIQDGEVKCAELQSAGLIENPDFFRSVLGTVYESMGIPFKAYDAAILAALQEPKITGALKQLQDFKYLDATNSLQEFKKKLEADNWKANTIEHVVNIYNSKVTDQTKTVVLAVLDGLIKMGPVSVSSGLEYLSKADSEDGLIHLIDGQSDDGKVPDGSLNSKGALHFNAHDNILQALERFLEAYAGIPGGVSTKAVAVQFLSGNFAFNNENNTTTGLRVVNADNSSATGQYISSCIPSKYIDCAPRTNIFVADGSNYADAFNGDKFTVNNIASLCGPNFTKLNKNGDEVEGYELPATFANSQPYIHLSAAGQALPTAKQYTEIQKYIKNAISMDLSPFNLDIEQTLSDSHGDNQGNSTSSHSGIISFALEFPNACNHEDASKLEYLTLSYLGEYTPEDNASATNIGKWKLSPIDTDKNVTVMITARMYDSHTNTYETLNTVVHADVPTYKTGEVFNPFSDMDEWMSGVGTINSNVGLTSMQFHMVKEMLVRNFSDAFADNLPTSFSTKMSMMRYVAVGETNTRDDIDGVSVSGDTSKSNNFVDRIVSLSGISNPTTEQRHYLEMFKSQLNFIGNPGVMDIKGLGMTKDINTTDIDDIYKYALKANTQINAIDVKTCLH